jgi:cobalt-zinc-cadmium efflux system protein
MAHTPPHAHISPRRVLIALTVTVLAAAVELVGSARGNTLFLAADACHLFAHVGIFGVLLIPTGQWHDRGEDVAATAVLIMVALIAVGIAVASVRNLTSQHTEPPEPSFMLLSLFGLGANLTSAFLFAGPAKTRWAFRAALVHELADGGFTVVALLGALTLKLFAWVWIDPGLSLAIAFWLGAWSGRLLDRRVRFGRKAWTLEDVG